ncbi:glutamine-hydrolyzing carbamoyl-phosphate synthase small subunit [bacterium]|nr:glutamine-hydrolyzing carbamoyl-phosphate synthase small subunit [bacterium]
MPSSTPALLVLSDGYSAKGRLAGQPGSTIGKLVFNTGMTGYQETLTDPSYAGEILVFTFPLIGIYGVTSADYQSEKVHARGVVISELSAGSDNWRADRTLTDMLLLEGITGIHGIDTRRLTRHLRDNGEKLGMITTEHSEAEALEILRGQPDFSDQDLVPGVSCRQSYMLPAGLLYRQGWEAGQGAEIERRRAGLFESAGAAAPRSSIAPATVQEKRFTVAAYDFGIKRGILDNLSGRGCEVHVFPATASAAEVLACQPDGVFLSNGPGDPARMDYVLPELQRLIALAGGQGSAAADEQYLRRSDGSTRRLPVFGICLGNQLLARAAGIPTYRLKFGNRGANHPVLDLQSGLVNISSQNHSYAVALSGGPAGRPAAAPGPDGSPQGRPRGPLPVRVCAAEEDPAAWAEGGYRPAGPYAHPLNPQILVTHLNVNDGSCEGLRWADRPVFSVQYHPEGCPGPRDNTYLFDEFIALMEAEQAG